ncbi:MAG: hypothetical protein HYY00_05970 [Chloroflexi bacterium]|nr:hypothetical protein [Chloroflexota bacterium]
MHTPSGNSHQGTVPSTPQEVVRHGLERMTSAGPLFRGTVIVLGALFALGIVGFIIRASQGFDDRLPWGYYAAVFGYFLTTAQSAPMVAIALRAVKAGWRRPVARVAEMWTVVGVLNLLWFLPIMALVPTIEGRRSLWVTRPIGAPHAWDLLVVLFLAVCGLGLLYTSALPDLAAVREKGSGFRQRFARTLSSFWRGTRLQWNVLYGGIALLGTFYAMLLVFGHALLSTDVAMSMVPGWKDAIFPAFHALSGLQSAVAVVIVTLFVLRTWGGYKEQIHVDQFWGLSKLLLAFSLLWFYFWFSGFITFWYGRAPTEQVLLRYLYFESYRLPFLMAFFLNFVAPIFLVLLWNPFRKSILGPTLAAAFILVGTLFDRIRIYVAAFSAGDPFADALEHVPAAHLPGVPDILIVVGGLAGAVLMYMLAVRLIPVMAWWELKEGLLLRRVRPFLRRHMTVVAKPD